MRKGEPVSSLIAILIAIVLIGSFVFVFVIQRLQLLQNEIAVSTAAPVDVSGWQTYANSQYGFELEYPPEWQISTGGLANQIPFITVGNPLNGTSTYDINIFIENNSSSLSSGEYAHAVIAAAKASSTLLQFDKTYVLTVGSYPGYELYNVFEFDHDAEQIYVAHGTEVLRFDFPVMQENPNISLPVANNEVAHDIADTLVFTN